MEYSAVDPSAYGIKIGTTPQPSTSDAVSGKKHGNRNSGDASCNSPSARPSSASSGALHAAPNASQSTAQSVEGTRSEGVTDKLSSSWTTAPTSSSTVAPHPPTREPANTNKQERLEARWQRSEESRKRKRRDHIAREVGHEVDSDGEREYWREVHDRHVAEETRRQSLSPEARRQEEIEGSAEILRRHIKPQLTLDYSGLARLVHYPLFLLQTAPNSRNGAKCKLDPCIDRIAPGQYRIALSPGIWDARGLDFYHVKCFEELLDLSSSHYVERFEPDRRKHIPDHGAQCILEEYISRWKLRTKQTPKREDPQSSSGAGQVLAESLSTQIHSPAANEDANTTQQQVPSPKVYTEPAPPDQVNVASNQSPIQTLSVPRTAFQSLSAFKKIVKADVWNIADALWAQVCQTEARASEEHNRVFDLLDDEDDSEDLASPPTDQDRTWHITQYLLPENDPDYDERHALSRALEDWDLDIILADKDMSELSEAGRAAKEALGELTIKRIKRYQHVRMPDYQSLFFGGR